MRLTAALKTVKEEKASDFVPVVKRVKEEESSGLASAAVKRVKEEKASDFVQAVKRVKEEKASDFVPAVKKVKEEEASDFIPAVKRVKEEEASDLVPAVKRVKEEKASDIVQAVKRVKEEKASGFVPAVKTAKEEKPSDLVPEMQVPRRQLQNTNMNRNIFSWTVGKYPPLKADVRLQSENFIIRGVKWFLRFNFILGKCRVHKEKCISIYHGIADDELTKFAENSRVYAEFKFIIRNQLDTHRFEYELRGYFCRSAKAYGFGRVVEKNDASLAFILKDNLVAEVEITRVEKSI